MTSKKICFFRLNNHIGDVVITSFFVRELKKHFASDSLTVVASDPVDKLYFENPHVNELLRLPAMCYPVPKEAGSFTRLPFSFNLFYHLAKILWNIRRQHYDLLITDIFVPTWRNKLFFKCCAAKHIILPQYKQKTVEHLSQTYGRVLKQLGMSDIDYAYELYLSPQQKEKAMTFLKQHALHSPFILLNPLASITQRSLSEEQIITVLDTIHKCAPHIPILLLDYRNQYRALAEKAVLCHLDDIRVVTALIQQAKGIITVDTSTVHLSDLFYKPMLAIYAHDKYSFANNIKIFGSIQPGTIYLQSQDKISDIPLSTLQESVSNFLKKLPN